MQKRVGVTYSTMTEAFNDLCLDLGYDPFQAGKALVSQDGRRFAKPSWECLEAFGYMRKAKTGRPSTLPEPWKTLAEKAGSVQALADEFGVAPNTLRRWASGGMAMSGPAKKVFEGLSAAQTAGFRKDYPDTDSASIGALCLSIRAKGELSKLGIKTIGELIKHDEKSLHKKGMAKQVIKELQRELEFVGLAFCAPPA